MQEWVQTDLNREFVLKPFFNDSPDRHVDCVIIRTPRVVVLGGVFVRQRMDVGCECGFVTLVRNHCMINAVIQLAHEPLLDLAIRRASVIHAAEVKVAVQCDYLFITALINTLKDGVVYPAA